MSNIWKLSAHILWFIIIFVITIIKMAESYNSYSFPVVCLAVPVAVFIYGFSLLFFRFLYVIFKNFKNMHDFLINKPIDFIFDLPNKTKKFYSDIISSDFNKKCLMVTFCIIIILCIYFQLFARYKYQVAKETPFWATIIKIDKLTSKSSMFQVRVKENYKPNKQENFTGLFADIDKEVNSYWNQFEEIPTKSGKSLLDGYKE